MLQYLSICNLIVSKTTSAKKNRVSLWWSFIGTVVRINLDHPPKSIDFMLHGGFLSAGWCIFNRYHMIARKGQLLLTHRSGHYWLALGRHWIFNPFHKQHRHYCVDWFKGFHKLTRNRYCRGLSANSGAFLKSPQSQGAKNEGANLEIMDGIRQRWALVWFRMRKLKILCFFVFNRLLPQLLL